MLKLIFSILFVLFNLINNSYAADKPKEDFNQKLDAYYRFLPSRSVNAMAGKVDIQEAESEYGYELKAFGKLPVKLSLDTQYIGIDDTVEVELPSHLTGIAVDLETTLPFFSLPKAYLRIGFGPSFYTDDWSFEASGLRFLSRYIAIYKPDERWTFITGIAVYPDFENEVLPVLGFIYKPNERLTFNIVPKRPNISYILNERATLFLEGGSAFNSEFEVTRDGSKNLVLRYRQSRAGTGINFKFNKYIQASASFGAVFNRSLRYRDGVGKVVIKDGVYTEVRLQICY